MCMMIKSYVKYFDLMRNFAACAPGAVARLGAQESGTRRKGHLIPGPTSGHLYAACLWTKLPDLHCRTGLFNSYNTAFVLT